MTSVWPFPAFGPKRCSRLLVGAVALALAAVAGPAVAGAAPCSTTDGPGTPYEGFGADTPGGAGQPVYRVTTLADSGPGSLRDALSAGNRCVVFDVAGTIVLRSQIFTRGSFVTVDGFSAPAPGVTLRDYGISMWGTAGVHDVIIRGLRVRNAGQATCAGMADHTEGQCWDGLQLKKGVYRVVVDHVSIDAASDGAIDIADSSDVTVQWSMLSGTAKTSLVERATRVSMHHNLFVDSQTRNPHVQWDDTLATRPATTMLDFRNNLVWNYSSYGTVTLGNAVANLVKNYYYSATRPLAKEAFVIRDSRVHASGNVSGNGADVDARGTDATAFAAARVSVTDACTAAYRVQYEAGARGDDLDIDAVDRAHLSRLPATTLPGCAGPAPTPAPAPVADLVISSLAAPATATSGTSLGVHVVVTNRGTAPTPVSRLRVYLSTDAAVSTGDLLLHDGSVAALAAGAAQSQTLTVPVPATTPAGAYALLLVVNADGAVKESTLGNNVAAAPLSVVRPVTPMPDLVLTKVAIPTTLQRGVGFGINFTVVNQGTAAARDSRVKIYLSSDAAVSSDDRLLRSRYVVGLAAGASQAHGMEQTLPAEVKPGAYSLLVVADAEGVVAESSEKNNLVVIAVQVR